ncbi:MAG: protein kinase [Thermoguttaceae bacterium]
MCEAGAERDPLEVLAAEFMERQRRGESPSVAEYAARHPELAADIEEVFPTIAVMERLKAHKEQGSSPRASLGGVRLERLGDFRILSEIGRGGMGIVYEAFQESLGRHVAVKVLPRQTLLTPQQLQRFQREAQTAARLHHTNIVPVFGMGEHEGFHYIVMQLIRGAGLDDVLARLQQVGSRRPESGRGITSASQQVGSRRPESGQAGSRRLTVGGKEGGTEVSRLASALVEGRFGQPHGFEITCAGGVGDPGQAREEIAGAGRPLSPAAAATEEISCDGDTSINGNDQAAGPDSVALPTSDEAWRFGPPYWRSVATIGRQVAEALDYAHAQHTLHRDIKPANLLLDSQGVAWLTDFGLAKAVEHDSVTQTGAMVGTLRYMAPEQFSGQADARSDIYGLGLTLYELLTLRPAFEDNSRSSLIAKITHGEPPGPRKLNPAIPRDLETIVLKAMAREPRDRYPTAGELARDLECFLEDRPIRARRTSAAERLWRWARRNRAVAGLLACTLALLAAVAVVASVGYVRTARANAQERQASAEEKMQRKKAEETSTLAVEALDSIFRQFAPDRTAPASAALRVSDAEDPITVPVQPVLSKEAAALLEHMLKFYDRLADQAGDDARLRRKVAEANRRVGDIRQRLGHYEQSKTAYLRAIGLYARLAESSPKDTDLPAEIARIHNELGNVCYALSDAEAGRKSHLDALATLRAASAESSASPGGRYELARTYYFLGKRAGGPPGPPPPGPDGPREPRGGPPGFVFDPRGPRHGPIAPFPLMPAQEGEERLDKALALWQRLVDEDSPWPPPGPGVPHERQPQPPRPQPDSPQSFPGGNHEAGEGYRQEAVDLLERLVADHPTVPGYRHLLARCYRETPALRAGRDAGSEPDSLYKATQILENLVQDHPDVADYRYDLSETYAMLADRGPWRPEGPDGNAARRSLAMLEKALALSEQLVAEHPNIPEYAVSSVNIRLRLNHSLRQSDPTRAEANLRKALDVQSTLARRFPENSAYKFWMAAIEESLGGLLQEHGRLPEARSALQDCIVSFKEVLRNDAKAGHVRGILAKNYLSLADVLRRMGEDQAAEEATRQARDLGQER